MSELKERLDNLRALMQEPEFLEGKGLSNEVNIRIFCYDPSDEMMVRHFIEQIMTDQSMNCHLIEHNLYEVFLSICEDKRIAKTIPAMEEKKGKEFIRDQMSRMANNTAFPTLIALCSIALGKPTLSSLAVLGEISISGTMMKVDELANSLQVCLDSGAKRVLLPITSAAELGTVPADLIGSFNLIFYSSAEDAVFKALGVE